MMAALDGGQSVPSQKKSGRGWINNTQVQDGIAPKMTQVPLSTQSLAEGQRNPSLRLVGASHSTQQCCARSSWKTLTLGQY